MYPAEAAWEGTKTEQILNTSCALQRPDVLRTSLKIWRSGSGGGKSLESSKTDKPHGGPGKTSSVTKRFSLTGNDCPIGGGPHPSVGSRLRPMVLNPNASTSIVTSTSLTSPLERKLEKPSCKKSRNLGHSSIVTPTRPASLARMKHGGSFWCLERLVACAAPL